MTTMDTAAPGVCGCGRIRSEPHRCEYQPGLVWCPRCLADRDDPQCCTPQRLARIITVPWDDGGGGEKVVRPDYRDYGLPDIRMGTANYGGRSQ